MEVITILYEHSLASRFLVSRVLRWNNARSILLLEREPRRSKRVYRGGGSGISRMASPRVVPWKQRTSYFPLTNFTAALDSSTIFSRMVAYVTRNLDRCARLAKETPSSTRSSIVYGVLITCLVN